MRLTPCHHCRWRFAKSAERVHLSAKEGLAFALPYADVQQLGSILQRKGYKVFLQNSSIYAFKGLAGKIGPIGVHAAMLLVMAGGLSASLDLHDLGVASIDIIELSCTVRHVGKLLMIPEKACQMYHL